MSCTYKLEGIIFDPALYSLTNGELNIKLGYKESAILTSLCEQPLEMIYREKLQDTLWQGVIGADTNLNRAIYTLRKKLSSIHSDDLDLIQTIPRVGYVLKCSVEKLDNQDMSISDSTSASLSHLDGESINNDEKLNFTAQNFIGQYTRLNFIRKMRHLSIYSIFLIGLIGITLWFYCFDNSDDNILRFVASKDNQQQLIYDARVNFDNDTSAMPQLFTLASKLNIKYIIIGLNYTTFYQTNDNKNRNVIFKMPAHIKNTSSLYKLISLANEKSLLTKPDTVNGINCSGIIFTKTYNKICVNAVTQVISTEGNVDMLSATLNYYDPRGLLLISAKVMGTITELNAREKIFEFTQFEYDLEKMTKSINDIKNATAKYLLQGWKYKREKIHLYKITDHLYFSCAYGGHLIKL